MNEPIVALDLHEEGSSWVDSEPARPSQGAFKQAYDSQFKVVFATTDELREKSYHLRYQVYCVEHAFEPVAENPGCRETDVYDSRSLHAVLFHRPSRSEVGTVRIILPQNGVPLPIQKICAADAIAGHDYPIPLGRTAEISRFAIAKAFRRRAFTGGKTASRSRSVLEKDISHICIGLISAFVSMSRDAGVTHLFAVMEPSLLRMIRCLGIYFEKLGPIVEYHGRRQPCICDIDRMLARVHAERPDVWSVLTDNGRIWPLHRWRREKLEGHDEPTPKWTNWVADGLESGLGPVTVLELPTRTKKTAKSTFRAEVGASGN